jgi:hypothetical protein
MKEIKLIMRKVKLNRKKRKRIKRRLDRSLRKIDQEIKKSQKALVYHRNIYAQFPREELSSFVMDEANDIEKSETYDYEYMKSNLNESLLAENDTMSMEPTWTSTPCPKRENRRAGDNESHAVKKDFHKPSRQIDASLLRRIEVTYGKNSRNSDTEEEQATQRQVKRPKISYDAREKPTVKENKQTLKGQGHSTSAENFELREEKNNYKNKKDPKHTQQNATRKSARINNTATQKNKYMHEQLKKGEIKNATIELNSSEDESLDDNSELTEPRSRVLKNLKENGRDKDVIELKQALAEIRDEDEEKKIIESNLNKIVERNEYDYPANLLKKVKSFSTNSKIDKKESSSILTDTSSESVISDEADTKASKTKRAQTIRASNIEKLNKVEADKLLKQKDAQLVKALERISYHEKKRIDKMNELGKLKAEIERLTDRQSVLRDGKALASSAINQITKHFTKANEVKPPKIATLKHRNEAVDSKSETEPVNKPTSSNDESEKQEVAGDVQVEEGRDTEGFGQ